MVSIHCGVHRCHATTIPALCVDVLWVQPSSPILTWLRTLVKCPVMSPPCKSLASAKVSVCIICCVLVWIGVYGLTRHDPWAILSRLCDAAFSRASQFKGQTVAMGDFNLSIDEVPLWRSMTHLGWADAAAFDALRRSSSPNTRGQARKSFILINACVAIL